MGVNKDERQKQRAYLKSLAMTMDPDFSNR